MVVEIFTDVESITSEQLELLILKLPAWRKDKVLSYKREIDRKLSSIAYILLSNILKREYNIDLIQQWSYNENGKPYLKEYPNIHFNISHSPSGVVCAVNNNPIGVDIESIRNFDLSVAKYISNAQELEHILNSTNSPLEFIKLWTKKESYLKLIGTGLDDNLKNILSSADNNVIFHITIAEDKSYVVTICEYLAEITHSTNLELTHNL